MSGVFQIGACTIDPSRNVIRRDGAEQTVEPKVMEVLCCLAAHEGEVMSRQALIDAVWGVAYGGDESLTRAISLLRKALQTQAGGSDIIQTIPKRGYLLKLPPADAPSPVVVSPLVRRPRLRAIFLLAGLAILGLIISGLVFTRLSAPPPSLIEGVVVVVQPFISSPDGGDGQVLTSDVTAALARFDQIRVRSNTSAETAANRPDARRYYVYGVAGTVSGEGAARRLGVQLRNQATGDTLWSGEEDISGTDRDRAVSTLAAELELAILQAAKTDVQKKRPVALSPWELVLLGTWVPGADREWQGPPTKDSYWVWERAIAKNPDFALAHASLAQVMANFALFDPPSDTPAQAARAAASADHALQLAPYDAGVLFQVALYHKYAGHRDQATAMLKRVLELEPDNVVAQIELAYVNGQCSAQSGDAITRLKTLDGTLRPANPAHWVVLSRIADLSLARGDYAQAQDYARRSRQIVRQTWSSITLAAADAALGDATEAHQIGAEHAAQWPALNYGRFADGPLSRWCLGGDTSQARKAFVKLDAIMTSPVSE